jgi:hypothetical protein|tara:strand:- start:5 stop:175 length:171 start_codon:yes stop_codon:yes gene_type:complete
MGKIKSYYWKESISFDDSLNDYLYYMHVKEQQEKGERSEAKIRKVSTRRCVDVKNK